MVRIAAPIDEFPTDTEAGLLYLQALVPISNGFPQIVLKHQIYSIISDKTTVDRTIVSSRGPLQTPPPSNQLISTFLSR